MPAVLVCINPSSNAGVRGNDHGMLGKTALRRFLMGKIGLVRRGRSWLLIPLSLKTRSCNSLTSDLSKLRVVGAELFEFRQLFLSNTVERRLSELIGTSVSSDNR